MHLHTPVRAGHSRIGQSVKRLAINKRPQVPTDMDIGPRRVKRAAHLDGMVGAGCDPIADIRGEINGIMDIGINRDERRIDHADADLLDRGDKEIGVALALQD